MVKINQSFDKREQQFFDGVPKPGDEKDFFDKHHLLVNFAWYGQIKVIPVMIGHCFDDSRISSDDWFWKILQGQQTEISLFRLVFALEAYRHDHDGTYPATLEDLRGRYLAEIPLDPFSGEAFRYVLEASGFLLYSIGPNGIDDVGRGNGDKPKGDDIRRRMPIAVPPTEPEA